MEYNYKDIIYVVILVLLVIWMFNLSTRQEQFSSEIEITGAHTGDNTTILGKLTVSELEVTGVSNLKGDANVDGSATFNGSTNLSVSDSDSDSQSSGGTGTFTNLTVDNLTVTNNSNLKGGANVEGKLRFRHAGANGSDDSDVYHMEKVRTKGNENKLRLTLNDDANEEFEIWGNSCGVTTGPVADRGCGGPGKKLFGFKGDGKMSATAGGTFGNTYVGPSAHNGWAGISHKDKITTGGYALIQSAAGQTLLNSAANQHVSIRQNNADKMRMETNGHFTTEGSSTFKGGANVEGKLRFRHAGANGGDDSDVYHMEKVRTKGNENKLRMTLNDDNNEEFEIWGGSCAAGNCGAAGKKKFGFKADGTVHGISSGGVSLGGNQKFGKITASELEVTGPSHFIGNTTTEGSSTFKGGANVEGKLRFRHAGANGSDDSDVYHMEKVRTKGNENKLRMTLNDDANEEFEIWGNSCSVNTGPAANRGCGGSGKKLFGFKGDGGMEATGAITGKGGVNVEGKLKFRHAGANGSDDSDVYHMEKVRASGNNNKLRMTLNDDANEEFEIWANSCGSPGGCGGAGAKKFGFKADGKMSATSGGIFGPAFIGQGGHGSTWAQFSHKDNQAANKYALIDRANGHTILNSHGDQPVSVRRNNGGSHNI